MLTSAATAAPLETDFGRAASFYDLLAGLAFGGSLRRAQRAALAAGLPPGLAPRILVLGGGTGWVLSAIWQQCPTAQVLYLETSATMLAHTQARLRRHPASPGAAVELRHGSQAALRPGEQFDALVTFFVLDCFSAAALPAALARLHAARRPGAPWLVADFWPAQRGWRHWLIGVMYWFFGWLVGLRTRQMPPWPKALTELNLTPTWKKSFFGQAVAALVWR